MEAPLEVSREDARMSDAGGQYREPDGRAQVRERALRILDEEHLGVVWVLDESGWWSHSGKDANGNGPRLGAVMRAVSDWLKYLRGIAHEGPV